MMGINNPSNGKDIEVYTDRYVYIRDYSGGIRKK